METTQKLTIGPNEPISIKQSLFLGLQHVLAMDVYVVPVSYTHLTLPTKA